MSAAAHGRAVRGAGVPRGLRRGHRSRSRTGACMPWPPRSARRRPVASPGAGRSRPTNRSSCRSIRTSSSRPRRKRASPRWPPRPAPDSTGRPGRGRGHAPDLRDPDPLRRPGWAGPRRCGRPDTTHDGRGGRPPRRHPLHGVHARLLAGVRVPREPAGGPGGPAARYATDGGAGRQRGDRRAPDGRVSHRLAGRLEPHRPDRCAAVGPASRSADAARPRPPGPLRAGRHLMLEVLEPGLLTTVQDGGRPGFTDLGVPVVVPATRGRSLWRTWWRATARRTPPSRSRSRARNSLSCAAASLPSRARSWVPTSSRSAGRSSRAPPTSSIRGPASLSTAPVVMTAAPGHTWPSREAWTSPSSSARAGRPSSAASAAWMDGRSGAATGSSRPARTTSARPGGSGRRRSPWTSRSARSASWHPRRRSAGRWRVRSRRSWTVTGGSARPRTVRASDSRGRRSRSTPAPPVSSRHGAPPRRGPGAGRRPADRAAGRRADRRWLSRGRRGARDRPADPRPAPARCTVPVRATTLTEVAAIRQARAIDLAHAARLLATAEDWHAVADAMG